VDTQTIIVHLEKDQAPASVDPDEWGAWQRRFQAHLDRFGHTIYNLDFGSPVPADDPAPLLETFKLFLRGEGVDPHKRQIASAERREAATNAMRERFKGRRLKSFQKNLERAQKYAPLREDGLSDVGLSYPLLRKMLREIGDRFVVSGVIETQDDIFWLTQEEVESGADSLDRNDNSEDLSSLVAQRKRVLEAARRVSPPMMLPQIKLFGKDIMALKSGGIRKKGGDHLKGVAASPGTVTAPACVLRGPQDFSKMKTGDVLVASLTTPAWTPLFARASAVVTDIGGPLSHGSIVAREYGIPAVLGTDEGTTRIQDGQMITVDGSTGIVSLL